MRGFCGTDIVCGLPSMKVPPKRKGNHRNKEVVGVQLDTLNESPSEKEGKFLCHVHSIQAIDTLNESPSEKEGKLRGSPHRLVVFGPQ